MRICGLDEAGRGSLAGPLVAAAVILKQPVSGLNDSKKLKSEARERIYKKLLMSGAEITIETVSVRVINNRGIGWANKEIFKRLIRKIEAEKYIVDGNLKIRVNKKSKRIKSVIRADATRKCVMAASIVAKVTRDKYMKKLHDKYPSYGWEENKGYGTKKHILAIRELGVVIHHRTIFVATALKK